MQPGGIFSEASRQRFYAVLSNRLRAYGEAWVDKAKEVKTAVMKKYTSFIDKERKEDGRDRTR